MSYRQYPEPLTPGWLVIGTIVVCLAVSYWSQEFFRWVSKHSGSVDNPCLESKHSHD